MYEPGSPSSPLATMNFSSPSAARVKPHFRPAGNPAPPRPRRSASFDLLEQLLGGQLLERSPQTGPVPRNSQHRLVEHRPPLGFRGLRALAGKDPFDDVRAGVDHVAVADRRRGMAKAQADGLGERYRAVVAALAELEPEPLPDPVDVLIAGGREARSPGAHADVARAARLEQVVVEGRDAVDGALGQAGALGGLAAVGVGDLSVALQRVLQHLERGRRRLAVMAANELDQVL